MLGNCADGSITTSNGTSFVCLLWPVVASICNLSLKKTNADMQLIREASST
jgi:hypothetical protein